MDYKEFFSTDNKSGWKSRAPILKKNFPEIHQLIVNFAETNDLSQLPFIEQIWHFVNNITITPSCLHCGGPTTFKKNNYNDYCSLKCANDGGDLVNRQKKSLNEKYGVDFYPNHPDFGNKVKKTKKIRYGDENYNNIELCKQTKKLKHNDENYNNPIKNKETCQDRYNVDNVFQLEKIKDKSKETNKLNLGVDYPTQSAIVKDKIRNLSIIKLKLKFPFIVDVKDGMVTCKCDKCNNIFEISRVLLNERYREGFELCGVCNPIGSHSTSQSEIELGEFIKSLNIGVNIKNRTVLDGKELDIYIPSHNLAIEYNGLYWHSELYRSSNYHINKTELCESKNIQLIHIFEDEWQYKQDIVKSRLKNMLGLTENKIFARKCVVKEIFNKDAELFLDNNHIQGNVNAKIKLGLYHNNELVSIMTFSRGRIFMSGNKDSYELVRFCNKLDVSVIGGASKLLSYFIKTYKPTQIVSYADRRWSQGNLYEGLGFVFKHNSDPNYWYINGNSRLYRFNFRKSELIKEGFDPTKSEHEIMLERRLYRIYDCGNKRYEMNF